MLLDHDALTAARAETRLPAANIESTITINAPIDVVWRRLIDLDGYPEWNPLTPRIDAPAIEVGTPIMLHVQLKPTARRRRMQPAGITHVDPSAHRIDWSTQMGSAAFLRTARTQQLTAVGPDQTRYLTAEVFIGLAVPLVMGLYRSTVQRGFDAVAQALAEAVG